MSTPVRRARYPFEIRLANGIARREPRSGGSHSTGEQTGAGSQPPSQTSARTTRPGTRTRVDDPPAEVGWHARQRHVVTAPLDFELRGRLHERFASALGHLRSRQRDGRWAPSVRAPASRAELNETPASVAESAGVDGRWLQTARREHRQVHGGAPTLIGLFSCLILADKSPARPSPLSPALLFSRPVACAIVCQKRPPARGARMPEMPGAASPGRMLHLDPRGLADGERPLP